MLLDHVTNGFQNKSYIENQALFDKYLTIFEYIKRMFDALEKSYT